MTAVPNQPHENAGFRALPGFPFDFLPSPKRVRVVQGGETVADSTRAMIMLEAGHLPVYYFPREDVRMALLTPTAHGSH